uniref:Uncharacterized protein n=1 Tax=Strigamia maritima TaxID=126957 RepID=T1J5B3_STRMM
MIRPYLTSYGDLLAIHVQEVANQLTTTDPQYFQSLVAHLQLTNCTLVDFKKIELFFKSSSCEISLREFWKVWGQEQIACKVFPVNGATRSCPKVGPLYYASPVTGALGASGGKSYLSHVPIKEGLQSIIKCLKSQDVGISDSIEDKQEKLKSCFCKVCRFHNLAKGRGKITEDFLSSESAFRRPLPGSRFHQPDLLTNLNKTNYRGATFKSRSNIFPYPPVTLSGVTSIKSDPPYESTVVQPVPQYFNTRFGISVSSYYRSGILSPQNVYYGDIK